MMIRSESYGRTFLVFVAVLVQACGGRAGDDAAGSTGAASIFGDARPSSDADAAQRIATRVVETTTTSCGGGCSADVAAGYELLAAGRMLDAWNALRCADTAEAAFGAGVARVLSVVESEGGEAVMKDLGYPRLPATDLFGPDGLLARAAARWNGQAELAISGGVALQIATDHVMADDWQVELKTASGGHDGPQRITFYVETDPGWGAGSVIAPMFDCANGGTSLGGIPYVSLHIDSGDEELDCSIPYTLPAGSCTASNGALSVVSSGQAQGDRVELELSELPLSCMRYTQSDEQSVALPLAHVSGHLSAVVTLEVDTAGLHPILQGDQEDHVLQSVSPSSSSTTFMSHAAAVAGELASARCYFAKAADDAGAQLTLPGAIYGGKDVQLGAADARMLASATGLAAATLELGTSYELALSLQEVACAVFGGLGEHPDCPSGEAFASAVNDSLRSAVTRHDRLAAARQLLEVSLSDFKQGAGELGADNALVRNAKSAPGWDVALDVVLAAQESLEARTTLIPYLTPGAHADLGGFFAAPPDPRTVMQSLLSYSEDCEDFGGGDIECSHDFELQLEYLNAFFRDHSDVDWRGEYEWQASDELENALEEIGAQLRDKGLALED